MSAIEDDYSIISFDVMSFTSEDIVTFSELMKYQHKPWLLYQRQDLSKRKLKFLANEWVNNLLKTEFKDDFDHLMRVTSERRLMQHNDK